MLTATAQPAREMDQQAKCLQCNMSAGSLDPQSPCERLCECGVAHVQSQCKGGGDRGSLEQAGCYASQSGEFLVHHEMLPQYARWRVIGNDS